MLGMNANRRVFGRRKHPRRTHDLLRDVMSEVDLRKYDMQLYGRHRGANRRAQERRSGEDRRAAEL